LNLLFRWNLSQVLVLLSGFVFLATENASPREVAGIQTLLFALLLFLGLLTFLVLICPPLLERILGAKSNGLTVVYGNEEQRDFATQVTAIHTTPVNQLRKLE
jgi:hypothetical protein